MENLLVIGSRGSKLALWQAKWIRALISRFNPEVTAEIEIIKTTGDVKTEPLSVIGGQGVFTKELEDALLAGQIDLAVHSLKDLPTNLPDRLTIAAICEREDARDALVLREGRTMGSVKDLPPGAVVGTSSQRRLAQLKYLRRDIVIKDLRGNVDTRLRKLDEGQYDALLLAAAGLRRLGWESRISALMATDEMLPAVGQGALAVETRANDHSTTALVSSLNHAATEHACASERAFLRALGGGCQLPIAGYAVVSGNELVLEGLVADPVGEEVVRGKLTGSTAEAEDLGSRLALQLLNRGADRLLAEQ
ncbi:MAG: hydroxymethylbilane synthase [Pyrinomonadaceae bacterium]|jgi:hydroxymethylbilane synthase|nr:hydroxymethylbilane synthase [Pyrinomonadaceae bacterium]